MAELQQSAKSLVERYLEWSKSRQKPEGVRTVHVDEVATAVASFYEKIRGVINWREEHLLIKSAIERMLRRRVMLKKQEEKIAEPLVLDIVRGGYFPNDTIPEAKIVEVQNAVDKYVFIMDNAPRPRNDGERNSLSRWLLSVAACEVEEILDPPIREEALMEYMEGFMRDRMRLNEGEHAIMKIGDEAKDTQIFIAVRKTLFKLDAPTITLYLLKRRYKDWSGLSGAGLEEVAKNIYTIRNDIEGELKHPLAEKFYRVCEKYDAAYLVLSDIISKNPAGAQKILEDPEALKGAVNQVYQERSKKVKRRMRRAAIYSTLSIFLSKVFLFLALEIPVDKYITGQFSEAALGVNLLVPPMLMLLLVVTAIAPRKSNLGRVTDEIVKIVYPEKKKEAYDINVPKKKGLALMAFVNVAYVLTYLVTFGAIALVLSAFGFGVMSITIFLIFFCLITFAGVRIRRRAKELEIEEEKKAGLLGSLWDWFVLPIVMGGKWLYDEWERHNALVVVFNSLIDMPFQTFVEFLEQWRYFLKEKKEELH